jgi:outer membrane biosynthesis protein TonB
VNPAFNQNSNGVSVVGVAGPAFVAEPPLSPPSPQASVPAPAPQEPAPVLEVAPAPVAPLPVAAAPVAPGPAEPETPAGLPLEGLLLRFGLITTEQLTEAMRERTATGKDIGAIVVERGWVDAAQLARVASYGPAFEPEPPAEPAPAPEPVPVAVAEPEVEPTPSPAPPPPAPAAASGQRVKVFVRLTSGERVDAGTFDGLEGAKARGAEIARTLAGEAPEWPFVAGRFLRPDTIVSLDVEPELSA